VLPCIVYALSCEVRRRGVSGSPVFRTDTYCLVHVLMLLRHMQVLDSALLRPGRFDRQVTVDRPDVAGRVKILKVHSRGKQLGKDVDFDKVARRTPGRLPALA